MGLDTFLSRAAQEFVAICAHLPTELKDDLKKVAELSEETHRLTAELSRDQVEILERAKEKYRQVCGLCKLSGELKFCCSCR